MRWFFFGSLMDRDVAELVLDRAVDHRLRQPGILHGYERLLVDGESYPALTPRPGARVTGVVDDAISDADMARMQFFESAEFAPLACTVELTSRVRVSAQTFLASDVLRYTNRPWDFDAWRRHEKRDYLVLVRDWMQAYGKREAHELETAWSDAAQQAVAAERTQVTRGKS